MAVYRYFCDKGTPEDKLFPNFRTMLFAGGLAGVISWALNLPIDTVKSIMQKDSLANPMYRNTMDCVLKNYREHGIRVFYKGFWPALLRAFPLNAVTLCIYDWTQQQMKLALQDYKTVIPPAGTTIREVQSQLEREV